MKDHKRHTKQKAAVRETVMLSLDHPTADQVFQRVRRKIPNVSLGTVYRNLNSLVEEGQINLLSTGRNIGRYDGNTKGHAHFICSVCHDILDLHDIRIETEELEKAGYQIHNFELHYFGICSKCNNKGG